MKSKLKIAMIGHKQIPSRVGGIEIVVEELAVRMAAMGHKVVCYNRTTNDKSLGINKKLKEYKGVKIKHALTVDINGISAVTSSLSAVIRCIFGRYDVIHFHAEGPSAVIFIPHFLGKRTVVTIHGLDWAREKWTGHFASKYIKFGEKMAAKYADEIIVLSKNVQDYFKKVYNRDTIFIPNGVNKPEILPANEIKQKWGLKKDSYILFVGRIVPEKGIRYLIKAFKEVKTDKKLVIVGDTGNMSSFTDEIHTLINDDNRIMLTGFVQGKALEELYSNAYVYVLPSDLEGMPLSLLEAMSFGNCCITSDIHECADVIEDRGITFSKGNVKELKNKLQMLCDNNEMVTDLRKDVSQWICKKYNWDEVTDKTLQLYKK